MQSMRLSLTDLLFPNLYGREGEDDGEQDPPDASGGAAGTSDSVADTSDAGDPQKKIAALTEEKDRHYRLRQEAEEELQGLRQFKEESERKQRTETENLKKDLENRDARIQDLTESNKSLAVKIAFLQAPGYEWHNPERALSALDLSAVEINEKGEVANPAVLKDAIKKLASEEAWMLKGKKEDQAPPPGSGNPPNPNGKGSKSADAEKNRLRAKYPALRLH